MDSGEPPFPGPKLAPYDPDRLREVVRGLVTLVAAVSFLIVIGFYLVESTHTSDPAWTHIKEAMQSVLPAVHLRIGNSPWVLLRFAEAIVPAPHPICIPDDQHRPSKYNASSRRAPRTQ